MGDEKWHPIGILAYYIKCMCYTYLYFHIRTYDAGDAAVLPASAIPGYQHSVVKSFAGKNQTTLIQESSLFRVDRIIP